MMASDPLEEIERLVQDQGLSAGLDFLELEFRASGDFFSLFEVLKMKIRHRLGLTLMYTQEIDDLNVDQQRQLEDGLLDACRDVGTLLIESGKLREGWMYLQPVGDAELSERLLKGIEPAEENLDLLIDVAITQGAAPVYGFGLLLEHYGTCNGITTFDSQTTAMSTRIRNGMAQSLVRHLYAELVGNVRRAMGQGGRDFSPSDKLSAIMKECPDLTAEAAHHIDTTHLASVMRIGRMIDDHDTLRMAVEMAEYGNLLADEYQYAGDSPFETTYTDHLVYYRALLGEEVDAAILHFQEKSKSAGDGPMATVVDETIVQWLCRLGRNDEALALMLKRLLGREVESPGIAPGAFEIANTPELLAKLRNYYRSHNDLLGLGMAILKNAE